MIQQALVGAGPDRATRSAAYARLLGSDNVLALDAAALADPTGLGLGPGTVVDLGDPDRAPPELGREIAARRAWLVGGAPPREASPELRLVLATPDLVAGPAAAMLADLDDLGRRTMSKAVVLTDDRFLGPALFRACLALVAFGGPLERIAARRSRLGSGGDGIWGVGRFSDGSIAYLEASTAYPPGTGRVIYQALGRDRVLEFDSRDSLNRVWVQGEWAPLPAHRHDPYAQFVELLLASGSPRPPEPASTVAAAAQRLYGAVLTAAGAPGAVPV